MAFRMLRLVCIRRGLKKWMKLFPHDLSWFMENMGEMHWQNHGEFGAAWGFVFAKLPMVFSTLWWSAVLRDACDTAIYFELLSNM